MTTRLFRLNQCVLFCTLILFGAFTVNLFGKTTLVVSFGTFPSAQEAGTSESKVNWNDADFSDDLVCTTCFAALELQHYLRLATGKADDFEIVDDRSPLPAGDLFLIGTIQSNAAFKPLLEKMRLTESQLNKLGSQEYLLKSRVCDGRRVTFLVGGDRRGVLYSVYGYLHDLGCRWFAPGKENEEVPSVTQFQDTAKTESPSFTTRGFHAWHNRANSEFLLWMARNRMNYWCVEQDNHPFLRKIGLQLECGGHEVAALLTKGKRYQDGKTYFEAHPEWFGLASSNNPKGVRGTERKMNFCTSNSDATDEFMKNILRELVEGRYRAADLIRFWMIDVGTWCECDSCKVLGTATDRNLLLVHRLVQEIKKARRDGRIKRDVRVRFLAYLDVLDPPSRPLPSDFDYTMATATFYPIRRCYAHNFTESDCSINADLSNQLYGWTTDPNRHYRGHLNVGEYYNVSRFRNLPICLKQTMSMDIPNYHEKGVRNFEYMHVTTQEWGSKALTDYQMAQQCWDVNTDCGELWTDYFERRYTSVASEMRQFYDELEKMLSNLRMLKYDFAPRLNRGETVLFPNEHLTYQPDTTKKNAAPSFLEIVEHSKECRRLIDSVRQHTLPQKIADRIAEDERCFAYAERTIDYYLACVEAFQLARAGKLEEAKQFQKEAIRLAEILKNDLDSVKYSYEPKTPTALEASLAPNAVKKLENVLGAGSLSPTLTAATPRVFLLSVEKLDAARAAVAAGEPAVTARLDQWLRDDVNDVFTWNSLPSVINNAYVPPGGTKNDYVSFAPYWWPNPDTADGLPFINRDGHVNHAQYSPEKGHDRYDLQRVIQAVKMLALASYLTDDARYAAQAKRIIRCWFLDAATKMNPHLEYGQAIPGRRGGGKSGIIDTAELAEVVDALGLLESRDDWDADVREGTVQWFRDYLNWLRKSQHGKGERLAANNHGTWYDIQMVMFALYVGDVAVARDALGDSLRRLDTQIEGDGRQPQELARTRSFGYSCGNLAGFMRLANLGETLDIDLWHATGQRGGTIRAAFDFLRPYARGETPWTYPDLGFTPSKFASAAWLIGDRFDGAYTADRPEPQTITWEEYFR